MGKPRIINDYVECISHQIILDIQFDDSDGSEFGDSNSIGIGLADDPNDFFDDQMDLASSEPDDFESDANDYSDEDAMLADENDGNFNIGSFESLTPPSFSLENALVDNCLPIIDSVKGYTSDNDNDLPVIVSVEGYMSDNDNDEKNEKDEIYGDEEDDEKSNKQNQKLINDLHQQIRHFVIRCSDKKN